MPSFQFSSIYFRNVTLVPPRESLLFQEKAEVLFDRVKTLDVLDIKWENEMTKLNPVFRMEDCEFEGVDDIEQGISGLGYLKFEGRNEQLRDDNEQCAFDYKGKNIVLNSPVVCIYVMFHASR